MFQNTVECIQEFKVHFILVVYQMGKTILIKYLKIDTSENNFGGTSKCSYIERQTG